MAGRLNFAIDKVCLSDAWDPPDHVQTKNSRTELNTQQKPKGPWVNRLATRLLTVILFVLIFWVLGFLVPDIKSIKGTRYDEIEKKPVDQSDAVRCQEQNTLEKQIKDLARRLGNKK